MGFQAAGMRFRCFYKATELPGGICFKTAVSRSTQFTVFLAFTSHTSPAFFFFFTNFVPFFPPTLRTSNCPLLILKARCVTTLSVFRVT